MKFEILKERFLEAVSLVERVAGKHVSLPVLSYILIEASGEGIILRATNLDVGIEEGVIAKVSNEGAAAVSGTLLKSFLGNSAGKNVLCEMMGDTLTVACGTSVVRLKTAPHDDFPIIPRVTEGQSFTLSSKELAAGFKAVVWSTGTSTVKPELSGVFVAEDNDTLIFAATDSFRLAEKRMKLKKGGKIEPFIVPGKNVAEMLRLFELKDGEVSVTATKNQVSMEIEGTHLSSRLIDGSFPDYKQIIPKEVTAKVKVLKDDFLQALKLAGFFADTFNQAVFSFSPEDKKIVVSSRSDQNGESVQEIKCTIDGEGATLTFNYRYILDALQMMSAESIELTLSGLGRPMVIRPVSSENFLYLVMPMNR